VAPSEEIEIDYESAEIEINYEIAVHAMAVLLLIMKIGLPIAMAVCLPRVCRRCWTAPEEEKVREAVEMTALPGVSPTPPPEEETKDPLKAWGDEDKPVPPTLLSYAFNPFREPVPPGGPTGASSATLTTIVNDNFDPFNPDWGDEVSLDPNARPLTIKVRADVHASPPSPVFEIAEDIAEEEEEEERTEEEEDDIAEVVTEEEGVRFKKIKCSRCPK
jgi:hypothetical protein